MIKEVLRYQLLFLFVFPAVVFNWLSVVVQAGGFTNQTITLAPGFGGIGSKIALGDFNNDGYTDILSGALWKNNGGTGFTVASSSTSIGLFADYNNDGLIDIYNYSSNALYRNQSTLTTTSFVPVSTPSLPMSVSRGASWADHNNDGYVDLYVGGHEASGSYQPDAILHNQSGTSFTKTWQQSGRLYSARGITSCDFDRDGDQDVYVSNYRLDANFLWQNNGNGNFTNVAHSKGVDGTYDGQDYTYGHTIGSAWGDLDNDGYMDLFVGNFSHPTAYQDRPMFYRNMGPSGGYGFDNRSFIAGLAWQESYATPALGDYDNDGDLDLFFTTVYSGDHPVLYRNDGNWNFTNVTAQEGLSNLGLTYQAAWADIDNDGDLDLVTDRKIFVNDESDTGTKRWLKVHLIGDGTTVNSAAIGTEVRITINGKTMTRQVEGGTGEGNQNDLTLHFGLGSYSGLLELEITSPTGAVRTITGVSADQLVEYVVTGVPVDPIRIWNIAGSGDWTNDYNWDGFAAPRGKTHMAVFGDVATGVTIVTNDAPVTVKGIIFDSANTYIITGEGAVNIETTFLDTASINVNQGNHVITKEVYLKSNTDVDVAADSSLTLIDALEIDSYILRKTGDGMLKISNGFSGSGAASGMVVVLGGTVSGSGIIRANLYNTATTMVAPGDSIGVMIITGDFSQGADATLAMELGGAGAGEFDVLTVVGSAVLGGSLDITELYTPGAADSWTILTAGGGITGDFASITAGYEVNIDGTNLILSLLDLGLSGDANNDGLVSADDYASVQSHFGDTGDVGILGDANLDGVVSADDYASVQANFGDTAGLGGDTTVPEPTTTGLLAMGLVAVLCKRKIFQLRTAG